MVPAIAFVEMLTSRLDSQHCPSLKWPNDVLLNGRKLAGVLGQSVVQNGVRVTIVGMGINVTTRESDFPNELRDRATSLLRETGRVLEREVLLAELLAGWEALYDDLLDGNSQMLRRRWLAYGPASGSRIVWRGNEGEMSGSFEGIGDRGELLLRQEDGSVRAVFSGDIET